MYTEVHGKTMQGQSARICGNTNYHGLRLRAGVMGATILFMIFNTYKRQYKTMLYMLFIATVFSAILIFTT